MRPTRPVLQLKYKMRVRRSAIEAFFAGFGSLLDFHQVHRPVRHAELEAYPDFDIPEGEALQSDAEALKADFVRSRERELEEVSVG